MESQLISFPPGNDMLKSPGFSCLSSLGVLFWNWTQNLSNDTVESDPTNVNLIGNESVRQSILFRYITCGVVQSEVHRNIQSSSHKVDIFVHDNKSQLNKTRLSINSGTVCIWDDDDLVNLYISRLISRFVALVLDKRAESSTQYRCICSYKQFHEWRP